MTTKQCHVQDQLARSQYTQCVKNTAVEDGDYSTICNLRSLTETTTQVPSGFSAALVFTPCLHTPPWDSL